MYTRFNNAVAKKHGVNAAILVQFIVDKACESDNIKFDEIRGKVWFRCSYKMFSAFLPFMSKDSVKRTMSNLILSGVLVKDELNDSRFDRTNWYSFTEYGMTFVEACHV